MSSYDSTFIAIDNFILLEILQRYKELGAFGDGPVDFVIGQRSEAEWKIYSDAGFVFDDRWSLTPAVAWDSSDEENSRYLQIPRTLRDVLRVMIDYMEEHVVSGTPDYSNRDEDSYQAMKKELFEREEEILQKFDRVRLEYAHSSNEGDYQGYLDELITFLFDPENGEEFHYIANDLGSEEIVHEEKIVNGKQIINR